LLDKHFYNNILNKPKYQFSKECYEAEYLRVMQYRLSDTSWRHDECIL